MAEFQEGVQVLFDAIEASDASSEETTTTDSERPRDYHQEQYPSYVPPHKRGHNLQQDKFVNFKNGKNNEKDREEGIDNDKYQRLEIPVPFALERGKMMRLKADFPGVYFHCRDNGNHDHPFSHMVTMIGTRFMQRRIRPGKRILDVYGNPNACDKFNASQVNALEPKFMKALVNKVGPTDFIREVNKWGPYFDDDEGIERYHRGPLMSIVRSGEIAEYDVLHLVHTLYYIPFEELAAALHAPGKKRTALALVHKHSANRGSINDGEQTYIKKWVGDQRLVRQTNVITNSSYVHPDLTELLFRENKVWMPKQQMQFRGAPEEFQTKGLAWELHIVNSETWIVEFVPYTEQDSEAIDYMAMWNDDENWSDEDPLSTPSDDSEVSIRQSATGVIVPTTDGKFIELEIPCVELFNKLRQRCIGKPRTPKLLEELIQTANHLTDPSALFGNTPGMRCPPDKVYDVAVAAFAVDIPKETLITEGLTCLRPVLSKHAQSMKLGPRYKDLCVRDLMALMRSALSVARDVNRVRRAADPIDLGINAVQAYLD